jgi:hypothetical protein
MNRSIQPFRSSLVWRGHTAYVRRSRSGFALDLDTWIDRLSPANRSLPVPAADRPAEPLVDAPLRLPEEAEHAAD